VVEAVGWKYALDRVLLPKRIADLLLVIIINCFFYSLEDLGETSLIDWLECEVDGLYYERYMNIVCGDSDESRVKWQ
jgi:hypothetical protein